MTNYQRSLRSCCLLTFGILILFLSSCRSGEKKQDDKVETAGSQTMSQLNAAIAKNPQQASLYFQRAQLFLRNNVQNQAFLDLDKACKLDSTNTQYLLQLADLAFKTFQIRKASETFEQVTRVDPKNLEAYLKLSELYFYIKGYQRCLLYTNEALKLDKRNVKAYSLRGFAYKEMGDTAKAVSSFNTVLDIDPNDYDTHIQLGNIYSVRANPLAFEYYNAALRIQPRSTEALYNRGFLFQNRGDLKNAVADYQAILKIDPRYSDAYFNLGYISSVLKKDYKEAIIQYTEAIKVNDQYAEAFYNRGVCYELTGDKEAARKDYRAALAILPTYKEAKAKLGQ
jgi:tetratricopeptide (TPR) repeat protein